MNSRLIEIFGYSHKVKVCGHRKDRKDNEKLNARLIKKVFGDSHQVQAWSQIRQERKSVENARLIRDRDTGCIFCYSEGTKDRGCPPDCYLCVLDIYGRLATSKEDETLSIETTVQMVDDQQFYFIFKMAELDGGNVGRLGY
ncbi:hypothetical protein ACROYT_G018249 [Oculina patagonica]